MPVAGPIIGAVGSLAGGAMQSNAAGNAGEAQTQASRDAINAQLAMYNQNRADTMPYQVTGVGALNLLAQMYGLPTQAAATGTGGTGGITFTGGETSKKYDRGGSNILNPGGLVDALRGKDGRGAQVSAWIHGPLGGSAPDPILDSMLGGTNTTPMEFSIDGGSTGGGAATNPGTGLANFSAFYQTPDYLVARDEGISALDRGASARGGLYSGGADADRMRFASNLGSQAFGNFQNSLFRLAGLGGQANSQLNALGQNTSNQVGSAFQNAGNARASAFLNQGDAWNNALQGVGSAFGQWQGNRG